MTDIELKEALNELETYRNELKDISKQLRDLQSRMYDLSEKDLRKTHSLLKRLNNTEKNGGNCHIGCEYYKKDSDTCYNYLMGVYTGLAFEVSKLDKCIKDIILEEQKEDG